MWRQCLYISVPVISSQYSYLKAGYKYLWINACKEVQIYSGWTEYPNKELWKTGEETVLEQLIRNRWNWLGLTLRKVVTAPSSGHYYSGHQKAAKEEGNTRILRTRIWRQKYGWWASDTAGGRWRWQHKTELDEDKRSGTCTALGVIRHKQGWRVLIFLRLQLQLWLQLWP